METVSPIFFYIFAGLAVLATTVMIIKANPVASALCLVFSLFCIAALYVLLNAPFVAILQVLVYAGAVMVLFVFVIMLLNLQESDFQREGVTFGKTIIAALGMFFLVWLGCKYLQSPVANQAVLPENFGSAEPVGRLMLTSYLVPFEMISILLLVAIIGVVLLGKKDV